MLELYNALSNSNYASDTKIEINTLQGVLFLDAMNDISFTLDDRIVILIEHQSTISENAPLRLLLYIARVMKTHRQKSSISAKTRKSAETGADRALQRQIPFSKKENAEAFRCVH